MKKAVLKPAVLLTQLVILGSLTACEAQSVGGVYAGIEARFSAAGGGSLVRSDNVLYLRKDGTYTDQLGQPDWKTAVTGTYTVQNGRVVLKPKTGKGEEFKLTDKGRLDAGNHVLIPLVMSGPIPAQGYKYANGSSSGGGVGGTPYVGTFRQSIIRFDGKGHFSQSSKGTVMISGDNIGGGTNSNDADAGTYTYDQGLLRLKYQNGETKQHTFFFSRQGEPLAVIDGRIYVRDKAETTTKTSAGAGSSTKSRNSAPVPTAAEILAKVKTRHGGAAIDAVQNLKVVAQGGGLTMLTLSDYQQPRSMFTGRAAGRVVVMEYWNGAGGWQWAQGKKAPLTTEQLLSKEVNRHVGVAGLHAARIAAARQAQVRATSGGYELTYPVEGKTVKLLIDKSYQLAGEEQPTTDGPLRVRYGSFRKVQGVLFPFTETQTRNGKTVEMKISSYEVNALTAADWAEPKP